MPDPSSPLGDILQQLIAQIAGSSPPGGAAPGPLPGGAAPGPDATPDWMQPPPGYVPNPRVLQPPPPGTRPPGAGLPHQPLPLPPNQQMTPEEWLRMFPPKGQQTRPRMPPLKRVETRDA